MIRAVIFDMDGVIIDSEPVYQTIDYMMFQKYGVNISRERKSSYVGISAFRMWKELIQEFNVNRTVEELVEEQRSTYLKQLTESKGGRPIKGIPELLENIKNNNIKIAIASSSAIKAIEAITNRFGIEKYFDALVTGDSVEKGKPEPDIFLAAAKQLGIEPHECVVIEDSHNGVIAAKRANMKCIGYSNPNSGIQDLSEADYIIDDFDKLSLKRINELFVA